MSRARTIIWISGGLCLSLAVRASHAQSGAISAPASESVAPAPDSTPPEEKKKGGLLGKAKKIAGNKAVQQVAKTMACTMVPGGSAIAGAIDAASSKDPGQVAAGAAGAAAGQTCIPGGMNGGAMGAASGMPGVTGVAGVAGAAGLAGAATGAMGGYGSAAMPAEGAADAMGYTSMPGMPSPEEIAGCMGLTAEEYLDFTDPTRGEARPATKDEMKRQGKLARKVDMGRYQACMMQPHATRMAPTGQPTVQSRRPEPDDAGAEMNLSEAPGKSVTLSADPAAELAKGRTVVKDIDWLAGGSELSETGAKSFGDAMSKLAAAITSAGGAYRADIYLDKRYEDAAGEALGSARLAVVRTTLESAGVASGVVTSGRAKKDKNPRLEIVKVKN